MLCRPGPASRTVSRASSRDGLDSGTAGRGLESPGLLRRVLATSSPPSTASPSPAFNMSPAPAPAPAPSSLASVGNGHTSHAETAANGSRGAHTNGVSYNHSSMLSALHNTATMLQQHHNNNNNNNSSAAAAMLDNSREQRGGSAGSGGRGEEERLTWLQKQQRKLAERRWASNLLSTYCVRPTPTHLL